MRNADAATPDIADPARAAEGVQRIEWAARQMPVLAAIGQRFAAEQPLRGLRIAACLHVTTETAQLLRTLKAGGAEVVLCASNPLSTQDDVAAALSIKYGIPTFAVNGVGRDGYFAHIDRALAVRPQLTMDDGCDLVERLHRVRPELLAGVLAGTEETTTGVTRLRAMAAAQQLRYPVVGINEAQTKHLFDNRYGTGQSTLDGIIRATNVLLAGRCVVVAGYGWCGRGVAARARGHGARVVVCEIEPLRALEATMDGFEVLPMSEAAAQGDIFVTATGNKHVLRGEHFAAMRDGALLCNTGHFDVEIELPALRQLATVEQTVQVRTVRPLVDEFTLADGRRLCLLAEGRLVNLAAAEGHPAAVMDMSFANQALTAEWLAGSASAIPAQVLPVPAEIDREVARLKLAAEGRRIDTLTAEQAAYLADWQEGT